MNHPPSESPDVKERSGALPDQGHGVRHDRAPQAARQPWWIPPFLGRVPPEVTPHQLGTLGVIALALLFEHYDVSMLGNAAPYIRESFGIPQSELGQLQALVRLGALPAVLLVPFADRIGRRRLFLGCVAGTSLATLVTAFSQTAAQFIAIQMVARTCLIAGSATAFVIVAEEFPAEHRGWAIGILGALGAVGFGLGAALFSMVESLPYQWRSLYVIGIVPMALFPMFRRRVPETSRFERQRDAAASQGSWFSGWWRPFATLIREYPARTLAISAIGLLASAGHGTAHGLLGDYVQTDRGFTPGQYSLMVIFGGAVGILGNTIAGRLADRHGRRTVGFVVLAGFPLVAAVVYNSDSALLVVSWILLVFFSTGGNTIVRALSTELFPTSTRGTATGSLTLFETLGASLGLFVVSYLTPIGASYAPAATMVVFVALFAAVIAARLPETARRELEDISG